MRYITAKYKSTCHECRKPLDIGDEAQYDDETKWIFHPGCEPEASCDTGKSGPFSTATDGYRKPETAEQTAARLGFKKHEV